MKRFDHNQVETGRWEDEVLHLIWNMIIHVSFCTYNYRYFVQDVTKQFQFWSATRLLLLLMGSINASDWSDLSGKTMEVHIGLICDNWC